MQVVALVSKWKWKEFQLSFRHEFTTEYKDIENLFFNDFESINLWNVIGP